MDSAKNNILISVIVPTYNRNDLLEKCLTNLTPGKQTLDSSFYEVIVTDDSKDKKAEPLIKNHFSWVKWIEGPHRGPAANRNKGAKTATGKWIAFIDDDCIPELNWLESFFKALGSNPNTLVFEGKTISKIPVKSPIYHSPVNPNGGYLWSCNMMIEKQLFFSIGAFDENFPFPNLEDVYFRMNLQERNIKFIFIGDAVVDHPPRKIALGFKIAKQHESQIYLKKKILKRKSYKLPLLKEIFITRIRTILNYPISKDSFIAASSLIAELMYTIVHLNKWSKKYE